MNRKKLLQHAKPILFNTDMVRAILGGRKTVTRRLPSKKIENKWFDYEEFVTAVSIPGIISLTEKEFYEQYPPYKKGDILYVRETWGISNLDYESKTAYIVYKSSEDEKDEGCRAVNLSYDKFEKLYDSIAENNPDWRPSIHMPKEAARIFLKVKNIRAERLQDIDDDKAKAEGANWKNGKNVGFEEKMRRSAVERFAEIWNSTIKKSDLDRYGWDANPWVWVIEFERLEV